MQNDDTHEKKKKQQKITFKETDGVRTLEKESNINLASFDTQHLVDPLFKKTTKMFDDMGLSSLLSSQLQTTSSLLLQLDSQIVYETVNKDPLCKEFSRYTQLLSD